MVGNTLAAHMLRGNFATNRVTNLNNKANSIDPLAFLPQRNLCMVEQMRMRDMIANTEKSIDVLNMHKSKVKTSIAPIGTMVSIIGFSSLRIYMDSIIIAITIADNPPTILRQFLMKFIRIINRTEWARWYDETQSHMLLLHWHCYSFLERVPMTNTHLPIAQLDKVDTATRALHGDSTFWRTYNSELPASYSNTLQ
jgi:hypothetical protein